MASDKADKEDEEVDEAVGRNESDVGNLQIMSSFLLTIVTWSIQRVQLLNRRCYVRNPLTYRMLCN